MSRKNRPVSITFPTKYKKTILDSTFLVLALHGTISQNMWGLYSPKLFTQQNKTERTQILSNDQRRRKERIFLAFVIGWKQHLLLFCTVFLFFVPFLVCWIWMFQTTKNNKKKQNWKKVQSSSCCCANVRIFLLQKRKNPTRNQKKWVGSASANKISYHFTCFFSFATRLLFLFCNSFAFSLLQLVCFFFFSTRLSSTTTPPPTLSFVTRFQKKKKTGICSNLNVLFCHHQSPPKKTKLRNIVSPKTQHTTQNTRHTTHDTRHTTHDTQHTGEGEAYLAISWFKVFWECCWDTGSSVSYNTWNEAICCSCSAFMAANWAS